MTYLISLIEIIHNIDTSCHRLISTNKSSKAILHTIMLRFALSVNCRKWHRQNFKFRLNSGLFLWYRSVSCRNDLLLHMCPLWLAVFVFLETDIWFRNELDKDKNTTYIHWTQKMTQGFWKVDGSDTNKIVTSWSRKVNTWRPLSGS